MEIVRQVLAAHGFKDARKKRKILGPHDEKVVTGVRLGRSTTRAPHQKMSELRAAIHRLKVGIIPAEERARYIQNLNSRIAHIGQINAHDAEKLKQYARRRGISLN